MLPLPSSVEWLETVLVVAEDEDEEELDEVEVEVVPVSFDVLDVLDPFDALEPFDVLDPLVLDPLTALEEEDVSAAAWAASCDESDEGGFGVVLGTVLGGGLGWVVG